MNSKQKSLAVLFWIVILNYAVQVPYYFHQYYFPRHLAPNWSGTALLAFTLIWFLLGYFRYIGGKRYGLGLLLSFLIVQVLFYGHAILFSVAGQGAIAQLRTHNPFLFIIFSIGYLNFFVAAYYAYKLMKHKNDSKAVS